MKNLKNLIIAIILIIILYFIYNYYNQENFGMTSADILTSKDTLDILRKMLKDTHAILTAKHIQYWIDGGTLLGAVRHKNIIPWDDDADIVITEKDKQKFLSLRRIFYKFGYGIVRFWGGFKIFPLNGKPIKHTNRNWHWSENSKRIEDREIFNYKYPFIDVFFAKKYGNIFHFSNKYSKKIFNKFYHEAKDLYPLKEYTFDDFKLIGPNNPKPYLDRGYGDDHMTTGYKSYDHQNMSFLPIVKFKVEPVRD